MTPVIDLSVRPLRAGIGAWIYWLMPDDEDVVQVRILRKLASAGAITGPSDASATVLLEGVGLSSSEYRAVFRPVPPLAPGQARRLLDLSASPNQTYLYAIFATNAGATLFADPVTVEVTTPDLLELDEPDLKGILMEFLDQGLARCLARGTLRIAQKTADRVDRIEVREAPPNINEVNFPCVSVHLDDDRPSDYGIGDIVDQVGEEGMATGLGYLSKFVMSVGGWAGANPAVRYSLYRVLKGLLMSARELLLEAGAEKVEVSGGEREDFESYDMPMYSAEFQVQAWVVSQVARAPVRTITDIDVVHVPA